MFLSSTFTLVLSPGKLTAVPTTNTMCIISLHFMMSIRISAQHLRQLFAKLGKANTSTNNLRFEIEEVTAAAF